MVTDLNNSGKVVVSLTSTILRS